MGPVVDPETGLIYLRARYYDPTTAQFLTPDPMFAITGERYGYAGNNPLNYDDPTGLSWYNPCVGTTCASDVGSGVVNAQVTVATGGQANCVRYVTCSARTKSLASEHKTTTKLLYLTLGVSATVASGGLLGEAAGVLEAGEVLSTTTSGLLATGAGLTAASGDYGSCVHGRDKLACAGLVSGGAGAMAGLPALLGGESLFGLGVGTFALVGGMIGVFGDAAAWINEEANGNCP